VFFFVVVGKVGFVTQYRITHRQFSCRNKKGYKKASSRFYIPVLYLQEDLNMPYAAGRRNKRRHPPTPNEQQQSRTRRQRIAYCLNCRRVPTNVDEPCTDVGYLAFHDFHVVDVDKSIMARKFCFIDKQFFRSHKNSEGVLRTSLCTECAKYMRQETVLRGERKVNQDWAIVWPAFVWQLLSSPSVSEKVGINIWCIIPKQWRIWWLQSFQELFNGKYETATLDFPKQVVRDLTSERVKADKLIKELKLFDIENEWDEILKWSVACPFGCTEFVHKTMNMSYDIVIARAFELTDEDIKFVTAKPASEIDQKLRGIRNDFLTFPMKYKVSKLNNPDPDWEILPAVRFKDGAPMFQVCRSCWKGSSLHFLYPPRKPFALPSSPYGEQIAPATVRSRVLKTGRASSYSDVHQMLYLQGHVNGVDTIRITTDMLDTQQENLMSIPFDSLAIFGREDIRAFVIDKFTNGGPLSLEIGDTLLDNAAILGSATQYLDLYASATYIDTKTALRLEADGKSRKKPCAILLDDDTTGMQERKTVHFTPIWPRVVPFVHPLDGYGCKFPSLYVDKGSDRTERSKVLWMLCGILSYVNPVWNTFAMEDVYDCAEIDGYILTFAALISFPHLCGRISRTNPFMFGGGAGKGKSGKSLAADFEDEVLCPLLPENAAENLPSMLDFTFQHKQRVMRRTLPNEREDLEEMFLLFERDEPDIHCVIFTGCRGCDVSYNFNETSWELRLVGGETLNGNSQQMYVRHGDGIDGWWKISSKTAFVTKVTATIDIASLGKNTFFAFVKLFQQDLEMMRDTFLVSIGGQNKVYCAIHNKPLIVHAKVELDSSNNGGLHSNHSTEEGHRETTSSSSTLRCCNFNLNCPCTKMIAYCCPIKTCHTRICSRHMKRASENAQNSLNKRVFVSQHDRGGPEDININERSIAHNTTVASNDDDLANGNNYDHGHRNDNGRGGGGSNSGNTTDEFQESAVYLADDSIGEYVAGNEDSTNNVNDGGMPSNHFEQYDLDCQPQYIGTFDAARAYAESTAEQFVTPGFYDCEDLETDNNQQYDQEEHKDDNSVGDNNDHDYDSGIPVPSTADLPNNEQEERRPQGVYYGNSTTASLFDPVSYLLLNDATSNSVSGSVVLNNCGTLLARGYNKLRPSVWQANFLQRLVATTPGRSIPLLYAEGTLFPSIFWKDNGQNAVLGAVPTALLASDTTLARYGIASIPSHLRNRLRMEYGSGCCDNQDYLCYAYDSIANLSCRGEDTRLVVRRGSTINSTSRKEIDNNLMFDSDSIESRPHVNQLCAKMRDSGATYFGSHSCNYTNHFGLKMIKSWIDSDKYFSITLEELKKYGCRHVTEKLECDVRRALMEASTITVLRHWHETTELYMKYICHSPELPLGKVVNAWYRHEYQDTVGNLSHLHFLLWIDQSQEDLSTTMNRIRGGFLDFLSPEELQGFIRDGYKVNHGHSNTFHVQDLAEQFLTHICNKRCQKRHGINGDLVCRVTNNGLENPQPHQHSLVEVNVEHSDAATDILIKLGLVRYDEDTGNQTITNKALKGYKHYPPARAADGKFSPCNNRLFAATKSNQNLTFVTGYFASRYVAKYSAKIDESNRVYIGAGQNHQNAMLLDVQFLHNTKISGSRISENKKMSRRKDGKHPTGRAISIFEMMQATLGYDMVYTNIAFEYLPTKAMGDRPGRKLESGSGSFSQATRTSANFRPSDDLSSSENNIATYLYRNKENKALMQPWQLLAPSEILIIRDSSLSNISIDKITIFGVRPPELRFVRRPELYFKWFYSGDGKEKVTGNVVAQLETLRKILNANVWQCAWVDGFGHRVFVRPKAIPFIIHHLSSVVTDDEDFFCADHRAAPRPMTKNARQTFIEIFLALQNAFNHTTTEETGEEEIAEEEINDDEENHASNGSQSGGPSMHFVRRQERNKKFLERFIGDRLLQACQQGDRIADLPVIWYDPIPPTQGHRFLVHLLLTMGEFDNEVNLMSHQNMRECCTYARLIPNNFSSQTDLLEKACKDLLKRYVLEQLIYQPCGTKQFDRFLVAAFQALRGAILFNELHFREMPAFLYSQLVRALKETEHTLQENLRTTLAKTVVDNLEKKGINVAVEASTFINATAGKPFVFNFEMQQGEGQTQVSYEEQQQMLNLAKDRFLHYKTTSMYTTKGLIINGGPGTGKTTLMELMILHAYSAGLYCILTAVMSERASQLGGLHISQLMCIPVRKGVANGRLAEMAYLELLNSPEKFSLLRRLDVLFIDEFGQVSAELLATMDMIMRRVRNSSQFMGGILIIGTYDYLQLPPVEGRPPLLSPFILTSFILRKLEHSVRAGNDAALREIQHYTRLPPATFAKERQNFTSLVKSHCTFVDSFEDPRIGPSTLRMFGKKKATSLAVDILLNQMKQKHGTEMKCCKAEDCESSVEGVFVPASSATSRFLNNQVKEPSSLWFYPGAVYEITNNKKNQYSQAQLAVLCTVPSDDHLRQKKPVAVMLAPPGCKSPPPQCSSSEDFETKGWRKTSVGLCPDRIHSFHNGIQAKRSQYALRPRIASTIHSGMGQDLPAIVTKVTSAEDDIDHMLWAKEQVIVLLSRTHYAKDIIFVGNAEKTAEALADCLQHVSQYTDYMAHLMETLSNTSDTNEHTLVDPYMYHPFRMCDYEIPNTVGSFCYNLVSLGDPTRSTSYIGETHNLAHRLAVHNQRNGANTTKDIALIPWGLLGFVTGFEGNSRDERRAFESEWQIKRNTWERRTQRKLRPDEIGAVAVAVIRENPHRYANLVYVRCGKMQTSESNSSRSLEQISTEQDPP
jgi:predicted GIY-YIG superfamily endonuclease